MKIKKIRIVTQEYLDELNEQLNNEVKCRNSIAYSEKTIRKKYESYKQEVEQKLKILNHKNIKLTEEKEILENKLLKNREVFISKIEKQNNKLNSYKIKNKKLSGKLGGKQSYINKLEKENKELAILVEKIDKKRRFLEKKILPPTMDRLVSYTERKKTKSDVKKIQN